MSAKNRNSNLELLRILSMYMIVFIHANMFLPYFCPGELGRFFNGFVNGICNIGVTCFILISGYFGMQFKISKLVKMECMMITYSLLELVVVYLVMPEQLQGAALLEALVKACFPFITRKYWFYSCYVCVYLFSGFVQKLINTLEKQDFKRMLGMMLLIFSVFPTVCYFEIIQDNGKGLVQMFMVYLIGRYIRLHGDVVISKWKCFAGIIVLWAINGVSHEIPLRVGHIYHHLCKDNSITNIVTAILIFYIFKELKVQSGLINRAATCLFAAFALNNTLVTLIMDERIRGYLPVVGGVSGFLLLAGVVFVILVVCIAVGALRELLLGRVDRWIGNKAQEIVSKKAKCIG